MLLRTHIATALSLALLMDTMISNQNPTYAGNIAVRAIIYITVYLLQVLIDNIGHAWKTIGRTHYPARNRLHSLPAMIGLSLAVSAPISLILREPLIILLIVGTMILHWLEDLFTEAGVYMVSRRIRLPIRIRYDNTWVNRAAIAVLYLPIPFYVPVTQSVFVFALFIFVTMYNFYAFISS